MLLLLHAELTYGFGYCHRIRFVIQHRPYCVFLAMAATDRFLDLILMPVSYCKHTVTFCRIAFH